jgi:putative PEP-CTERM system TPR-repeat lipoprotein
MIASALLVTQACSDVKTVEQYQQEAAKYVQSQSYSSAVIALKNAIKIAPDNPEIRLQLGKIYLQQGDYASAEKELEKAKEHNAKLVDYIVDLSQAKLKLGKFDDVYQFADEASTLTADKQVALLTIAGMAAFAKKDEQQGKKYLHQAIALSDTALYSQIGKAYLDYVNNDFKTALAQIEQLLKQYPKFADAIMLQGYLYQALQQYEQAAKTFEAYLKLKPKDLQVNFFIAQNYINANQPDKANDYVDKILAISKNHPYANQLKAQILFLKKDYEQALAYASKVFEFDDNSTIARIIASYSAYKLNKYEQAYQHIKKIKDKVPANHILKRLLIDLQLKLGYDEEALESIKSLEDITSEDATLLTLASKELLDSGNKQAAEELLETSINLHEANPIQLSQQGILQLKLNNTEKGIALLEQALEQEPALTVAENALAVSYLSTRQLEKAMEIAKKWQQDPEKKVRGMLYEVNILQQQQQDEKAKQLLHDIKAIAPKNIVALYNLGMYAQQSKNYNQALDYYLQIIAQKPLHKGAMRSILVLIKQDINLAEKTVQFFNQHIKTEPDNSAYQLGLVYVQLAKNEYEQALTQIEKLQQQSTEFKQLDLIAGDIYRKLNDWKKAQEYYKKALVQYPNSLAIIQKLLTSYDALNMNEQALKLVKASLKHHEHNLGLKLLLVNYQSKIPSEQVDMALLAELQQHPKIANHWLLFNTLGNISFVKNEMKEAALYYEKAYKANPLSINAIQWSRAIGRVETIDSAIQVLKTHIDTSEQAADLNSLLMLANAYLVKKDDQSAELIYQQIVSRWPNNLIALNNLADIQIRLDKLAEAETNAKKALALAPQSAAVNDTLGQVYLHQKNYPLAIKQFELALAQEPSNAAILLNKAKALIVVKQKTEALQILHSLVAKQSHIDDLIKQEAQHLLSSME